MVCSRIFQEPKREPKEQERTEKDKGGQSRRGKKEWNDGEEKGVERRRDRKTQTKGLADRGMELWSQGHGKRRGRREDEKNTETGQSIETSQVT